MTTFVTVTWVCLLYTITLGTLLFLFHEKLHQRSDKLATAVVTQNAQL